MSASSIVENEAMLCDGRQVVVAAGVVLNVNVFVEQHGVCTHSPPVMPVIEMLGSSPTGKHSQGQQH
jgi:hypothetical protein